MKRIAILIATILAITLSCVGQTQTTPTHLKFKNGLSTDSIGTYTGDSLIIDGGGLLKFRDTPTGTKTLAELENSYLEDSITKHTDTLQVHQDQIAAFSATRDSSWTSIEVDTIFPFNQAAISVEGSLLPTSPTYSLGQGSINWLAVVAARFHNVDATMGGNTTLRGGSSSSMAMDGGDVYIYGGDPGFNGDRGEVFMGDGSNGYLNNDEAETNLMAYDTGTGLVTYRSAASIGGGSSDSSWTSITVDTITELTSSNGVLIENVLLESNDVTVPVTVGHYRFGDGDTYFLESIDDNLSLYVGASRRLNFASTQITATGNFLPENPKTWNLGTPTFWWNYLYTDRAYIDNTNTYLDVDVSNNMTFTDAVTGTKTLAELAAGGGSYTFQDGLTESGGTVSLGGTVTNMRYVTGNASGSGTTLRSSASTFSSSGEFRNDRIRLYSYGAAGYVNSGGRTGFTLSPTSAQMEYFDATNISRIYINSTDMIVSDDINSIGLQYNADYSTNYTARSLIDSAFAATIIGGGDVTKVGTPVNNQIGVWTGDGTLEGTTDFTYDATTLNVGIPSTAPMMQIRGSSTPGYTIYSDANVSTWIETFSNSAGTSHLNYNERGGGTYAAQAAAPTDAIITRHQYNVHDGTSSVKAGEYIFQVDGAVATGNLDTKYTWDLKEGASASGLMATLGVNGFEYNADHSTDQAANNRWIPDKEYVDGVITDSSWTSITVDTVKFTDTNTEVWEDGSSNLSFKDAVTGTKTLAELAAGGGSFWTDNGTYLSPTGNEDIRLVGNGDLQFGGTTTFITGNSSTNLMNFWTNGTNIVQLSAAGVGINGTFLPIGTQDNGGGGAYWANTYSDRYYVENALTYIDKTGTGGSTDMIFSSPLSGTKTLAELAASGSGDMTKAVYDTDDDGAVDAVESFTPASGSITLSGADAITLASTATTSVTLPTSGTLATTGDIGDSLDTRIGAGEIGLARSDSSGVAVGSYTTGYDHLTDLALKIDKAYPSINAQTGTTYTFVLTDGDNFVTLSNAAAITATVPPNSSVAYTVGTTIDCAQIGAGAVTFAQGSGVTINSFGSDLVSAGQYATFTLLKTATDTWLLFGNL